jgi:hypothetical protein
MKKNILSFQKKKNHLIIADKSPEFKKVTLYQRTYDF